MEASGRIYHARPGLHVKKVGREAVLIPVRDRVADMDHVFSLNETGAFLWKLLEQGSTREELIGSLEKAFDVTAECAARDVDEFLLAAKDLITLEHE